MEIALYLFEFSTFLIVCELELSLESGKFSLHAPPVPFLPCEGCEGVCGSAGKCFPFLFCSIMSMTERDVRVFLRVGYRGDGVYPHGGE